MKQRNSLGTKLNFFILNEILYKSFRFENNQHNKGKSFKVRQVQIVIVVLGKLYNYKFSCTLPVRFVVRILTLDVCHPWSELRIAHTNIRVPTVRYICIQPNGNSNEIKERNLKSRTESGNQPRQSQFIRFSNMSQSFCQCTKLECVFKIFLSYKLPSIYMYLCSFIPVVSFSSFAFQHFMFKPMYANYITCI